MSTHPDPLSPMPLDQLDDFWRRGPAATRHRRDLTAYGHPLRFLTNHPALLEVAGISERRYTQANPIPEDPAIQLRFLLDSQLPDAPVPEDWPGRLRYHAAGPFLTINREPWVNAFADLKRRQGVALVSASICQHPRLLSRYIADCFVLNMLLQTGWGQLHASCVIREETAVLFSARHNTGKSTTAFRLVRHGYGLLSDGMSYVRTGPESMELLGYPVGEIKLRPEMLDEFAALGIQGDRVLVREDEKYVFDLRKWKPERVISRAFQPQRTIVCLLERQGEREDTLVEPISALQALEGLWPEALHLDEESVLRSNLASLRTLVERSDCYRLTLGTRQDGIVRAVNEL